MCSILGIFDIPPHAPGMRERALEMSRRQRHRGPDWSGIYAEERAILAHERLAIVDVLHGAQPLRSPDGTQILAVNGEIYNHRELRAATPDYRFQTDSDCEVILALHEQIGPAALLSQLNGMFAFALYNAKTGGYLIARDPIGIIPLYAGHDEQGCFYVASELKALIGICPTIREFPPGHYFTDQDADPVPYFAPAWRDYATVKGKTADHEAIRNSLEASVERHLMCDVPYGVLLSGGLDSSLVTALCQRHAKRRVEDDGQSEAWWPQLHSFAIGLEGSPDLAASRRAADSIGTVHHEFVYTVQEGLDALRDVIYHIETFDVTTVRASTPMYLLGRRIRAMGIKMVLSGEGADELFGGYLYFHKAPNAEEFHEELVRKLDQLHLFDCLRANKSLAAWGIEGRVPFLDREFLDTAMSFDAADKMCSSEKIEKHVLRQAFDGVLPDEILWRQKEQFSDGVGYSWIDSLREAAEAAVPDKAFQQAADRFPQNTPASKEAYFYRTIFEEHFPGAAAAACVPHGMSIACSTPTAIRWDQAFRESADPSGRAVRGVHRDAY